MSVDLQEKSSSWGMLADILQWRALHEPEKCAYTFLLDGEVAAVQWTYAELDAVARRIAALLQSHTTPGERVLLLYQPGLEYIAAIFGCFYAGVVAVPAYPPRLNHNLTRIEAILQDAQAAIALTTSSILSSLRRKFATDPAMQRLQWLETDMVTEEVAQFWQEWHGGQEDLALLQYTSGSTGTPKGVMLTHGNLIQNARLIQESVGLNEGICIGSWLPPYHDMGLMGGILEAVYVGAPAILMAPTAFLQQPLRWLRMISRYNVGGTCAPNFAYDLCVRKATSEQLADLDLSCLRVAMTGAEPVKVETLERFAEMFAPYGFHKEAFYSCYGLAEATLFVSGGQSWRVPQVRAFAAPALEAGHVVEITTGQEQVRSFVGCGFAREGQQIIIVDPERRIPCASDQVGEIWVTSPNIAQGYWGKVEETEQTFQAYLQSGEGPFLRTGDLGFFWQGELFITGRLKDVIIIRGRNLYPQDIEQIVETSHPALRQGCGAAFAVSGDDTERLVIVQEVERHYERWDVQDILQAIRRAVVSECEVEVAAIVLLRAGTIYKTSSGKIQRHMCRQHFLDGSLSAIEAWRQDDPQESPQISPFVQMPVESIPFDTYEEIISWLTLQIATHAHLEVAQIDIHAPLVHYGLDSLATVSLSETLGQRLRRSLSPTLVYDYPSIEALARYLSSKEKVYEEQAETAMAEPIAIVGMSCCFPGAENLDAFWQLLTTGTDAVQDVPPDRWDRDALHMSDEAFARIGHGGFVDRADQFDAHFFGLSAHEVQYMDPQQRVLLEVAWESLENAGLVPGELAGSTTGVFIGIGNNDYGRLLSQEQTVDPLSNTGNSLSIAANRLSYLLDLKGPSVAVDTACSSALVAVHMACQSLRCGEANIALAGSVNLIFAPEVTLALTEAQMISATGRCRTFDSRADGYVRSEGCGVLVLQRLSDAQRQGQRILAVIRGSAVNQNGRSNGLTAPNGLSQQAVIRRALRAAQVTPAQISYVEAHGTGTPLGDPVEVQALNAVLEEGRNGGETCLVGSVKTNLGHLEAAAGIAGLIKVVLSLQQQQIPPHLHFETINPHIPLSQTCLRIPTTPSPWSTGTKRRFAGVSSFGFGGTNAHMILEEGELQSSAHEENASDRLKLLVLSARTSSALEKASSQLGEYLQQHPEIDLADVASTLQSGRTHFRYRRFLVSNTREEAIAALTVPSSGVLFSGLQEASRPQVAFMFPGIGSQYVGMAHELYLAEPMFRSFVDQCATLLQPHLGLDLRTLLYPVPEQEVYAQEQLVRPSLGYPALFVISYAYARLWMSRGIVPGAMIGHSMGEYVAACLSGVLSLDDALAAVAVRGRLFEMVPAGAMLSVALSEEQVQPFLGAQLSLAAINSPSLSVVSGPVDAIERLARQLQAQHIETWRVHIAMAAHSVLVEPMLEDFLGFLQTLTFHAPAIPYISNVTGTWVTQEQATDPNYWIKHTRQTVRFADGFQKLAQELHPVLLEVGPGQTLSTFVRRGHESIAQCTLLSSMPHRREQRSAHEFGLQTVGRLWLLGVKIEWRNLSVRADKRPHLIALPTYPFERQHYPLPSQRARRSVPVETVTKSDKPTDLGDWFYAPVWKRQESYASVRIQARTQQGYSWLVFLDHNNAVGDILVRLLEENGHSVIIVRPGDHFGQVDERTYVLHPHRRGDYETLLQTLDKQGSIPQKIVHAWAMTPPLGATETLFQRFDQAQVIGFYSVLFLTQALAELPERRELVVVFGAAHVVTGDETISAELATIMGFCRVIPCTYTHITCRCIDVVVPTVQSQQARLGAQLKHELLTEVGEAVVAYRGAARWIQTAEAIALPHQPAQDLPLREKGVYLITGGLGGIGLELGRSLAQLVQATLILLQRSALPERAVWSERIARQDEMARTLQTVQDLEALGAEVVIQQVDVADPEHMRIALDEIMERFGAIHGVIHAAGVSGDTSDIGTTTIADIQRMLIPKAYGALVLQSLLADQELDFLVFCSSLSSFFNATTSVSYSAANNFLDAFAQSITASAQTTQLTLSINWDIWGEVGMAARVMRQDMTVEEAQTQQYGQYIILAREGREAFLRSLGSGRSQVFVTSRSFQNLAEWSVQFKQASSLAGEQVSQTPSVYAPRPELANSYVAPDTSTEQAIASVWQDVLGFAPLGIHDNFFALGGDSILGIQIMARARQAGIEITPQQLFQHQTIAQLAENIASTSSVFYNQGNMTSDVDLLPVQQHFFAQQLAQPYHYNQAVLLQVPVRWSLSQIRHVAVELLRQHDALRLRFTHTDEYGWQQRFLSITNAGAVEIEHVDVRSIPAHELSDAIEAVANRVQTSLDIEYGLLLRMVFFELGVGEPARLLMVMHHLIVDERSWRILLEDMQLALTQLSRGESIQLPVKALSLQDCAMYVRQLTQEAWLQREVSYWHTVAQTVTSALPVDLPGGDNTYASARQLSSLLTPEETRYLFDEALKPYRSQIQEVLLVPLLQVLSGWLGDEQIRIELEGHVRENIAEMTLDASRTVGWFTYLYPVLFALPQQQAEIAPWMNTIKEQLRAVPHRGVGYGLLRYLADQSNRGVIVQGQSAEVAFLYRSELNDTLPAGEELLQIASEPSGIACGLENVREHLLEVSSVVVDGRLRVTWTYSEQLHRRETIEGLADEYMRLLRAFLEHCLAPVSVGWTPADFSLTHLTPEQLDLVLMKHPQIEDIYLLTPLQQGMLFHTLREPGSGAYFEQVACTFRNLSQPLFVEAWEYVISQRSILRTAFTWQYGEDPLQLVERQVDLPVTTLDWRDRSVERQRQDLEAFKQEDRRRGFDLQQAPLMRLTFIYLSETRMIALWSRHQILLDGWSIEQLIQDVFICYIALMQVQIPQLQPRRAYRDYLGWLEERSQHEDEAYWRRYLAGFHTPVQLGVDLGTSGATNVPPEMRYSSAALAIPSATHSRWQMAARQYQVTLNTLVQGAWALLLSRYSGCQDVLFGAVASGRPPQLAGIERMIGLFINTLPVRVQIEEGESVKSWLIQLQEQQFAHRQYEHCALMQVQGWSEVPRDQSLFESVLIFENYPLERDLYDQGSFLNMESVEIDNQTNYPLTIVVVIEDELRFRVNYDRQHFDEVTIQRLLSHLQTVLEQFTSLPDVALQTISLLTSAERQQLLTHWRATSSTPKSPVEGMYTLFEVQAEANPDAVAVVWGEQMLTYAELNRRANQLARYLQTQGVRPEVRVGVLLARSPWALVVILSILKAGGAYVPLDPALPDARLCVMAQDAHLTLLITSSEEVNAHTESVGIAANTILLVEDIAQRLGAEREDNPDVSLAESNLAYIVYTSGSTGRPKGVLSTHGGVVNYLRFVIGTYHLTSNITVLQIPPLSFDASVRDIFATLSIGGRLVLMNGYEHHDMSPLVTNLREQRVTALLSVVPSFLRTLLETADSLQQTCPLVQLVLLSGERLPLELVSHTRRVFAADARVVNQYGPTETTMTAMYYQVELDTEERGFALIGRPIQNMQTYLLDQHLQLVPVGVIGEVYLAGSGLARGYVGLADVTSECFVPDPYTFSQDGGTRMYRTGDLARYRAEGVLEYIGRRDQQVKVRGNRVELGEIVAALEAYPGVGRAIVIAREGESELDVQILAYIVSEQSQMPASKELRTFLQAHLPEYMLPSYFIALEAVPLMPNGKLDRRALPLPVQKEQTAITEDTMLTPLQAQVVTIWAEVLHLPHINLQDDFFELGGHSLLALQLINRVRITFDVDLPLGSLFETPTIAEMVRVIEEIQNEALEQTEAMRLTQLLDSVEGLSEEELDRILSTEE